MLSPTLKDNARLCRTAAAALIIGAACLRIAYLISNCPLDLAPDEAHYWDWSRHLDFSYYSKGPLVAYLIRAGCVVAGEWSRRWIGSEMVAVRLPAVLCGTLFLASLYVLTVQVFRRETLALGVVAFALCSPVIAAGSSLMTIDSPYVCCWGWALVVGYYAISRGFTWAWMLLGLIIGLGILAKYTMVLWLLSALLLALTTRELRGLLLQRGIWIAVTVAAACCLPILIWNIEHGAVTLRHVSGQAGLGQAPRIRWWGPVSYLGVQFGVLIGFAFCAWAIALFHYRPGKTSDIGVRYLWWMSVPTFVLFLLFSPITVIEPNWPMATYVSGLILSAGWIAEQFETQKTATRRLLKVCLAAACVLGLSLTILVYHSEWVYPLLSRFAGAATAERPLPLRRLDPTCRLRGWPALAGEVDRLRDQLRQKGTEPIIAGVNWTIPGEIGFYCQGHPTVYSLGSALGDRHSQYDLWRPNPVDDPSVFREKTFIVVGGFHPLLRQAFRQVEESQLIWHRVAGQPVACWKVCICRGFCGFPGPHPEESPERY